MAAGWKGATGCMVTVIAGDTGGQCRSDATATGSISFEAAADVGGNGSSWSGVDLAGGHLLSSSVREAGSDDSACVAGSDTLSCACVCV